VGICSGGYHSIFFSAPLVNVLRERQLRQAASKRQFARANALERPPRTVAEARAQVARNASREEVVAARKERRAREKAAAQRSTGAPAKYRRKARTDSTGEPSPEYDESGRYEASGYEEPTHSDTREYGDSEAYGYAEPEYALDPLDAQNAGMHEHELTLGHEEIHLNLDDPEHDAAPLEAPVSHKPD
ncbi:MAG: hypothetical protein M3R44_01015, partial [Candidatus Eremiobacteraeota bacterium]|nr:hypothetical protein [Candidatus Eremiobacteraeota bacterium]